MGRRFVDLRVIQQRMQHKDDRINRAMKLHQEKQAMAIAVTPGVPTVMTQAPSVTQEHLQLIKTTIAQGATPAELELFLYDNARQGVHPLDRLIHFTKRAGKYTPITSIDFMRQRAAESGECAGIDDAIFAGTPKRSDFAATVTVYRLVQGQRFPFTATARWMEYKPEANDFMWLKMPSVMLGKCAEALALRKAFPKQLAGLYAKEELDQVSPGPAQVRVGTGAPVTVGASAAPANQNEQIPESWQPFVKEPSDRIRGRIVSIETESKAGRKSGKNFTRTAVTLDSGEMVSTLDLELGATAIACKASNALVEIVTKDTQWGTQIQTISRIPDDGDDVPL